VVVLTGHGYVGIAVKAMRLGTIDVLEKPFETDVLEDVIERALERIGSEQDVMVRASDAEVLLGASSTRERGVLDRLAQGCPNKTIAHDLGISPAPSRFTAASPCRSCSRASFGGVADRLCRRNGRDPPLAVHAATRRRTTTSVPQSPCGATSNPASRSSAIAA
jgi:FixJ family two-component response regulator